MRRFLLLIAMVVLITGCTGIISGLVIDENGLPVKGAIVQTTPPTNSILTSEEGYKINDVPTGEYTVTATKQGYSEGSVRVRVRRNKITTADIQIFKQSE